MQDHDEGFARNISRLFGNGSLYEGMADRPLYKVERSDDQEVVTFYFQDGGAVGFRAEGDCCSHSWIEHLEAPADVNGRKLVGVQDERVGQEEAGAWGDLRQFYQTKFRLDNGETIAIEYRNDSNGYYGGYLVREGL